MPRDPAWERHCSSLRIQALFVRGYSPLTAALLEQVVGWLSDPDGRGQELGNPPAVQRAAERVVRLLEVGDPAIEGAWINDLEPTLRLNACLHWYVLQNDPRVVELRPYYTTVPEGDGPDARDPFDDEFAGRLLRAAERLGDELFERARTWRVQSNETSRGIAWLLPAVCVGAEAVYLVELGCAAGLNLYAEQRAFELAWTHSARLRLGRGFDTRKTIQREPFLIPCSGPQPSPLAEFTDAERAGPEVLRRVGGDLHPINLDAADAEVYLEACVWGDQRRRLERLREGIEIHRRHLRERSLIPAELRSLELPDELSEFLQAALPAHPVAPVVAFNTYVTAYLSDVDQRAVARQMREFAKQWSLRHKLPWMWVRFEPARSGNDAPHPGWCRWLVEVFSESKYRLIELGWAHPHLVRVEFGPGLVELRSLRDSR
jgi:hypothetical protein